ncbi:MAG: glycosyltransferase family 4 protein [Alphaproteobacteria bacterium]|nr:glycosyltransferase family 4 protein [Alphaproteobacteria bacterium]
MLTNKEENQPIVLQVLPELEMGGVEIGTTEIAEALTAHGIKNFVASKGGRLVHELDKLGVPHFTLDLKTKNPFKMRRNAKKLAQIIKDNGINIVHARSRAPAWSAYWAAQMTGIHYMTTYHGTYGLGPLGIKKYYNRVMTYGERVIAISNHIRQHLIDNYVIDQNKIRLVHRCVNSVRFNPEAVTGARKINMVSEYNIPEDKPVILLGGRITHWKGQHVLIKALAKMQNKNFYCIIAGDDQGRTDYLNYLKKLAEKYHLSSQICFHGKVLDMPALMSVSSVIVSAAIEPEAFGRISIEGQAMGKIVIASNIGGSLDTITDGVTGKFFESNNPYSLADALDWALSLSNEAREEIAKAGIKNVQNNFTKEIMCDKTIAVYKELV